MTKLACTTLIGLLITAAIGCGPSAQKAKTDPAPKSDPAAATTGGTPPAGGDPAAPPPVPNQ
jgi:tetrahydromethanopterin S-methyltransferase subunit D